MQTNAFKVWLRDTYRTQQGTSLQSGPRADALSRCNRVELVEGDLDQHFTRDGLRGLIHRLTYSAADEAGGRSPLHTISIDGNLVNGTASLRNAIRLYQKFCLYNESAGSDVMGDREFPDGNLRKRFPPVQPLDGYKPATAQQERQIDDYDNDPIEFLQDLLEINQRRLQVNRLKRASFGKLYVPSHIEIEIDELNQEITRIREVLGRRGGLRGR